MALLEQALAAKVRPLLAACRKGDEQQVERLLAAGAHPNSPDELDEGWSPLLMAANEGHAAFCELLLEKGADIECYRPETANTALHLAMQSFLNKGDEPGKLKVVQVLIEYKAIVDTVNNEGWAPIMHAAQKGCPTLCAALAMADADVLARLPSGSTPSGSTVLILAAQNPEKEPAAEWNVKARPR